MQQKTTWPSHPPVARCHWEEGLQAAAHTACRWPVRLCVKAPDLASHSLTCNAAAKR